MIQEIESRLQKLIDEHNCISVSLLQCKLKVNYAEAKSIYDEHIQSRERVSLRPFQKGMICPECLKIYLKHNEICTTCPSDDVRADNAKIDRRLKRLGLIR